MMANAPGGQAVGQPQPDSTDETDQSQSLVSDTSFETDEPPQHEAPDLEPESIDAPEPSGSDPNDHEQ